MKLQAPTRMREAGACAVRSHGAPLGERPVVLDLLSLARALAHRGDRAAWLAVLRAPWCGLTLAELHALAAEAPDRTIADLLREGRWRASFAPGSSARLARTWALLEGALDELRQPGEDRVPSLRFGRERRLGLAHDLLEIALVASSHRVDVELPLRGIGPWCGLQGRRMRLRGSVTLAYRFALCHRESDCRPQLGRATRCPRSEPTRRGFHGLIALG